MTTEAVTTTMYDRIENPMEAIKQMGEWISKSGLFGCDKLEQGMILALTSYAEKRPVTDICRRYHIMDGKMCMKSEAMLSEFNQRGGTHFWEKSDDHEAILCLTKGSFIKFKVTYTLKDAERAGLCGKDGGMRQGQAKSGGWQKNPDALLRARCVSKGIRMVDHSVVVGVYTPEEVEDMRPSVHLTETKSLLTISTPAPATIDPEIVPPVAVDTPANTDKVESETPEVVEPTPPTDAEQFQALLTEIGPDAIEWMVAKKWIKDAKSLTDLPAEKIKNVLGKKPQFRQAVKTFKALQKKETSADEK